MNDDFFSEKQIFRLTEAVSDADHRRGAINPLVTIVKYCDFECRRCATANQILREIELEAGDKLQLVFRHFPLETVHPQSFKAAEAAEAAAHQGKFWEMHDCLFEIQKDLADARLVEQAIVTNLNVEQFLRDLADGACVAQIRRDQKSGAESGVCGTPTYFINGVMYEDAMRADTLLRAIKKASEEC